MPLTARYPWLTVVLWLLLLVSAVPLLGQVTNHLGSGGLSAPHSAAARADATVGHLVQPVTVPTTLLTGLPLSRLETLAKSAGMPVGWLHRLDPHAAVLVPGSGRAAAERFLGKPSASSAWREAAAPS